MLARRLPPDREPMTGSVRNDWYVLHIGQVATREITPVVKEMLVSSGVRHVNLKAPVAVRTYPPDLYDHIRIKDYTDPRVYTEELAVRPEWLDDMDALVRFLDRWDRRFTLFFFAAFERFEFTPGDPDDVLDEMAGWLSLPKIQLRYYRHKKTDDEWNADARRDIEIRLRRLGLSQ